MRICTAAKTVSASAGCTETRCATWVIAPDTTVGWPWTIGRITPLAKSGPNIFGCSCRRPSSSQRRPSPIWIDRADTRPAPAGRMAVS